MKHIIMISLLFIVQPSFAVDYKKDIDIFFKLLEKEQHEKAIEHLYTSNEWIGKHSDQVEQLKKQVSLLEESYVGKLRKSILIGEHTFKGVYTHITYLAVYDRQPIKFEFQYYKPQKEWRIQGFSFDADIDDQFEEAANIIDIKESL